MRARTKAGHLAPELSPIGKIDVEIERVIGVDRPGHTLSLAPCRGDDRLSCLLVQHDTLQDATPAPNVCTIVTRERVAFASITLIERQPGRGFQQVFALLAGRKHRLANGPVP